MQITNIRKDMNDITTDPRDIKKGNKGTLRIILCQ